MMKSLMACASLLVVVGTGAAQEKLRFRLVERGSLQTAENAAILAEIQAGAEKLPTPKEKDKMPFEKHDASKLDQALRDVITEGRKMFNDQGDHAGCYRLFQGSLMAVRPFLAKDLQARIDGGIAKAEKMPSYADRAWELRKVLDDVRASTKGAGGGSDTGKVPDPGDKGQVTGKVTYEGKPIPGGYFVTLVGSEGKKFSSAIQKDGTFQFKTPIAAGKYGVAIEPVPGDTGKTVAVPARYQAAGTSGIVVMISGGKNTLDFNLPR